MIKGVLFDLDGVITDTAHLHFLAWNLCAKKLGFEIDEQFNENLKGIDRVNSLHKLLEFGNRSVSLEEFNELLIFKNSEYLKLLQNLEKKDILEGIIEFLDYLDSNNIKKAICSVSKNAPIILNKLGLSNRFDVVVNPDDILNSKPSPDIFLKGAELLNLDVKECIGIEDSIAGIIAINDANIISYGIGDLKDANFCLNSTKDLMTIKL